MPKSSDGKTVDLVNWRKRQLLKRALTDAGALETILDLPCGDGSFWPVFRDLGVSSLVAAEVSKGMLDVASGNRLSPTFPAQLMLTSAFDIDLEDASVDVTACIDFYQHLASAEDQEKLLSELARVSRKYVALSVSSGPGIESQFAHSGFQVERFDDFFPVASSWRLYLLRKHR
jgi:ubiquinone/menaquinone biosynthesis C-methylase UbiE